MFGPKVNTISNITGVIEIPIASDAVVYTPSFGLKMGEYFAFAYKATSDGNVKLKIEFQQSHKLPDTEEAADVTYVEPESASDIESALADEIWHIKKVEPICLPYGRLKITGLGAPSANDASTTLQIKIGIKG
jgi:hypothetical protein